MEVEFAVDSRGRYPAEETFGRWEIAIRQRFRRYFTMLKPVRDADSAQRFAWLQRESRNGGAFGKSTSMVAIKAHQHRLLGAFRGGNGCGTALRLVIVHALIKKADAYRTRDVTLAESALRQYDLIMAGARAIPVPVPEAAAFPAPMPEPTPIAPVPDPAMPDAHTVWALMDSAYAMPTTAPTFKSLCRPITEYGLTEDAIRDYVRERLARESVIVQRVVRPDDPLVLLGALMGAELGLAARAHREHAAAALAPHPEVTAPAPEPEPIAAAPDMRDVVMVRTSPVRNVQAVAKILGPSSKSQGKLRCVRFNLYHRKWARGVIAPGAVIGPANADAPVPAVALDKVPNLKRMTIGEAVALLP